MLEIRNEYQLKSSGVTELQNMFQAYLLKLSQLPRLTSGDSESFRIEIVLKENLKKSELVALQNENFSFLDISGETKNLESNFKEEVVHCSETDYLKLRLSCS